MTDTDEGAQQPEPIQTEPVQPKTGAGGYARQGVKKMDQAFKSTGTAIITITSSIWNGIADAVTSRTGILLIAALLIYAFAPIDRGIQAIESWFHDNVYFNQSNEGVIVVDTPQLFTRERLINERLEESAWIEDQLEKVDTLLENDEFAQVDSVSVTQSLLSMVGENDSADFQANDFEQLGVLAEKLGASQPTPLQQFRDAKNYRERLSLQRYDSILDDAHDIGANTLHRMNFRLTLAPARKRSDSVAAVSIRVREPQDSRLLFDHYGRLVIETRKKMEETVESLLRDRMLIISRDFQFQTSELELIDSILKEKMFELDLVSMPPANARAEDLNLQAEKQVNRLVDLILRQQIEAEEEKARIYLYNLIKSTTIPGLSEELFPNYPLRKPSYWHEDENFSSYEVNAPKTLISNCGAPFQITNLSPRDFSIGDATYVRLRSEYIRAQLGPSAEGPPPEDPEAQKQLQQRAQKTARQFGDSVGRQFDYPCPNRENQITLAKLRLIGRLAMLERVGTNALVQCRSNHEDFERLVAFVGDELPPRVETQRLEAAFGSTCPASDLVETTLMLAERMDLSGGDYAQIGIVHMMQAKLTHLPLDTSSRTAKLGKFFVFDVTRCDLRTCKLRTRTKSEALADSLEVDQRISKFMPVEKTMNSLEKKASATAGSISPPETNAPLSAQEIMRQRLANEEIISEAGREEALRLFLELRCYADARSYTVWPRSGERLASYERDSTESGARFDLDSTLQKFTGLQARQNSSSITRQERDHIFGIGDWGRYESDTGQIETAEGNTVVTRELKPCSRELEAVLDSYDPNGTFVKNYAKILSNDTLGPEVTAWWQRVNEMFKDPSNDYCSQPDCKMTLEILMRIAQDLKLRKTQTKFSWIIAPRRENPRRASRHVALSVPLSALISLPSWWGHAELEITTCWVRPRDLKDRIPVGKLCEDGPNDGSGPTEHKINVPLPGKAQDVLQRIGFFIIRTPYLDTGWNQEEEIEAGRPAKIRLTGSRLWKNPRVRIGNQWHDKLEVLPNMQGVIATFECVQPTLRPGKLTVRLRHENLPRFGEKDQNPPKPEAECKAYENAGEQGKQPNHCTEKARPDENLFVDERQAEIWTSEGRTSPTVVKVHAFRPRYFRNGEMERPCWLGDDVKTGMSAPKEPAMAQQ